MKAREIGELREATLADGADARCRGGAARGDPRGRPGARVRQRRLGDGRDGPRRRPARAPQGWPRARRSTSPRTRRSSPRSRTTSAPEVLFQRQVIALRPARATWRSRCPRAAARRTSRGARRGPPPRARDDRVRRLRRRPHRRRGPRRPRGRRALAVHPAHPGGARDRVPRALRARGGDVGPGGAGDRRLLSGAVATPTIAGRVKRGALGSSVCSTSPTTKPAASMERRVGRLHSQPTRKWLKPFIRSRRASHGRLVRANVLQEEAAPRVGARGAARVAPAAGRPRRRARASTRPCRSCPPPEWDGPPRAP